MCGALDGVDKCFFTCRGCAGPVWALADDDLGRVARFFFFREVARVARGGFLWLSDHLHRRPISSKSRSTIVLVSAQVALRHTLSIRPLLKLLNHIVDSSPCRTFTEEHVKKKTLWCFLRYFCFAVPLPSPPLPSSSLPPPPPPSNEWQLVLGGKAEDSYGFSALSLSLPLLPHGELNWHRSCPPLWLAQFLIVGVQWSRCVEDGYVHTSSRVRPTFLSIRSVPVVTKDYVLFFHCELVSVSLAIRQQIQFVTANNLRLSGLPLDTTLNEIVVLPHLPAKMILLSFSWRSPTHSRFVTKGSAVLLMLHSDTTLNNIFVLPHLAANMIL